MLLWTAWRVHAVLALPAYPDPREALLFAEVARIQHGLPPELFHWPGTPWTWMLAWAIRLTNSTQEAGMLVVCRLLTIPFGVVGLLAVYGLASGVVRQPLIPTVLLAVAPGLAAGEANLGLVDTPALAMSVLALRLAALGVARTGGGAYALVGLAGVTAGLAMAFKLPAGCVVPAATLLAATNAYDRRARLIAPVVVGVGAVCGFVAGCPYIVRDALTSGGGPVFDGLAYELQHYSNGHFGVFATASAPARAYLTTHAGAAVWCLGGVSVLVAGALIAVAARARPARRMVWLWVWAATCVGAILVHRLSFPRHWLMACPPAVILASAGLEALSGRWATIGRAAVIAAVANGVAMSAGLSARESGLSTLVASRAWVRAATAEHGVRAERVGEEPRLAWLYPRLPDAGGAAELRLVARLEADVQIAAASDPASFRDDDFFPLTRDDFRDGPEHLALRDTAAYAELVRFAAREPAWVRRAAFLGLRPPFPLNALLHPEIAIYAPHDVAARLAPADSPPILPRPREAAPEHAAIRVRTR